MTGSGARGGTDEAGFGAEWSASRRRGSEAELDDWLRFALALADEADAIALRHFRTDVDVAGKADGTFVTEADTAIERLIRERIADRYPDHGIVGEEEADHRSDASVRWILDPIDGTHNYMRGVPLFGTLIACERDGELQLGVLSAPAMAERWHARRGGGAWAVRTDGRDAGRTRRLAVSALADVGRMQLLFSSPADVVRSGRAPGFTGLTADVWRARGFGDFWGYALVAEGAAEAMVEVGVSVWDLAAPAVLVEEAGGRVTDLDGRRRIDSRTMLASNGVLHEVLLDRLRG